MSAPDSAMVAGTMILSRAAETARRDIGRVKCELAYFVTEWDAAEARGDKAASMSAQAAIEQRKNALADAIARAARGES